jgi:hypothetical protein
MDYDTDEEEDALDNWNHVLSKLLFSDYCGNKASLVA